MPKKGPLHVDVNCQRHSQTNHRTRNISCHTISRASSHHRCLRNIEYGQPLIFFWATFCPIYSRLPRFLLSPSSFSDGMSGEYCIQLMERRLERWDVEGLHGTKKGRKKAEGRRRTLDKRRERKSM